jgi:hypothetical protein
MPFRAGERILKFPVEARREDGNGPAVAVKGGISDELVIQRAVDAPQDFEIVHPAK